MKLNTVKRKQLFLLLWNTKNLEPVQSLQKYFFIPDLSFVIPAKAGIQERPCLNHYRAYRQRRYWTPACAGVTEGKDGCDEEKQVWRRRL